MEYLDYWRKCTGIAITQMLLWLSLSTGKYYHWRKHSDQPASKSVVPRSHYLLQWEKEAIIAYRHDHFEEGYRRLSYMMLDEGVVAVSAASVYRILKEANLLANQWRHSKTRGSGFVQPTRPHQHWHLDISYINFKGSFVYLVALIDGYSRYIVRAEVRASVEALDIEILIERAREAFPGVKPVLITDNGPQFIAREFKSYLEIVGINHRRTRFYYPQSNGKIERFMQTCKNESVRRQSFIDLDDLKGQISNYIEHYNTRRLHSSLGYVTPFDMLTGRQTSIFKERRAKLQQARIERTQQHQQKRSDIQPSEVLATSMRSEEQNPDRIPSFSGCAEG